MARCILLAKNGKGTTTPNPLVGAVVVNNGVIIGEGWHFQAGKPHAEVNAIASVKNKSLLKNATIYVSLEPCSHFGKTPPCADLIINSGIKKVVVGSIDPNPKVAGKGILKLKDAGCDVIDGVLKEECDTLNKIFFTFHTKKRPYIILKWAQTQDGFIAPTHQIQSKNNKEPFWISNETSKQFAHKLRAQTNAILIGTHTALLDNPSLTTRSWHGTSPVRIVLDRSLKLPKNLSIFDSKVNTFVFTELNSENSHPNIKHVAINFNSNVPEQILNYLYEQNIQSVIIEGGTHTLQSFVSKNLWDQAFRIIGDSKLIDGIEAPKFNFKPYTTWKWNKDLIQLFKNKSACI